MDFRAYIETQQVQRVGHRRPVVVAPDTSVGDTAALMRRRTVGCVLVAEGDSLRGIFTERDLLRKVLSQAGEVSMTDPVSDGMTPDPVVTHTNEALELLLRRMHEGGFRHLPLLDPEDRVVGTISLKRVIAFLADQFAEAVYNLPPQPQNFSKGREGA